MGKVQFLCAKNIALCCENYKLKRVTVACAQDSWLQMVVISRHPVLNWKRISFAICCNFADFGWFCFSIHCLVYSRRKQNNIGAAGWDTQIYFRQLFCSCLSKPETRVLSDSFVWSCGRWRRPHEYSAPIVCVCVCVCVRVRMLGKQKWIIIYVISSKSAVRIIKLDDI